MEVNLSCPYASENQSWLVCVCARTRALADDIYWVVMEQNVIKMTLHDSNGEVKIQGQVTEAWMHRNRLEMSDALSTVLLNRVLEKVIRNIDSNTNRTSFNRTRQHTAYARCVNMWINGESDWEVLTHLQEWELSTEFSDKWE
jgi:hypothetical protein